MSIFRAIYEFFCELLLGCGHGHLTRPFTIQAHSYKVCLDCGHQFPYSLEKMRVLRPWEVRKLQHLEALSNVQAMPALVGSPAVSQDYADSYAESKAIA